MLALEPRFRFFGRPFRLWFSGFCRSTDGLQLARLLTSRPNLTVASLKALLLGNVTSLNQWAGGTVSGGRLNVYLAALAASGHIAPALSLSNPTEGLSFQSSASITIDAAVTAGDSPVGSVSFIVDGVTVGADNSARVTSAVLAQLSISQACG